MSRADVEAGVKAGLEAAAGHMLYLSVDAPRQGYNDLSEPFRELAKAIRALDPAAIAATVQQDIGEEDDRRCNVCGSPVRYGERHHTCGSAVMALEKELAALRDCDAKAEALDIILQAATEGTDWVYAEVPQQIAALRRQLDVEKTACDEVLAENSALHQRIAELERQLAEANPPANKPASPAQAPAPDHSEQR